LSESTRQSRVVEVDVVALIAEVDARKLYAGEACSSMFDYCRQVLRLGENEAYLRITVARASREHRVLLTMLRDGRLYLSGIAKLARHLTSVNREGLLKRASGMSHREIKELVRELEPQPDAPPTMRKLPDRSARSTAGGLGQLGAHRVGSVAPALWTGEEIPCGEGDPSRANGAAVELGTHRVQRLKGAWTGSVLALDAQLRHA
jgi:hypothetical protein